MLKKQVSRRDEFDENMVESYFRNYLDEGNCVIYKEGEIKIENFTANQR